MISGLRGTVLGLTMALLALPATARAATLELSNDELDQQGSAAFQSGFVAGEMGAASLGPVAESYQILKVRFVFGPEPTGAGGAAGAAGVAGAGGAAAGGTAGAGGTAAGGSAGAGGAGNYQITLRIYDDTGAADPGAVLHEATYVVVPSSSAQQEIDLSASNLLRPAGSSFRVAVEMLHDGLPSLARDDDGCDAGRNWIYGTVGSGGPVWHDFCSLGSNGDLIIRAQVETGVGSGGAGGTGGGTGGSGGGTGGSGGAPISCTPGETLACVGPNGCSGTQACADDGSGFGACVCESASSDDSTEDDGCGCAVPGGASDRGALLAALALLVLGVRRRRRQA